MSAKFRINPPILRLGHNRLVVTFVDGHLEMEETTADTVVVKAEETSEEGSQNGHIRYPICIRPGNIANKWDLDTNVLDDKKWTWSKIILKHLGVDYSSENYFYIGKLDEHGSPLAPPP